MKNPFLILLVGTPLSGKSTWIKRNYPHIFTICRDDIILENSNATNYNDAFYTADQKKIDKTLNSRILETSKNKRSVILDMTHLSSKRRTKNLSYFSKSYYKIAVVFPILSDSEYILRNSVRSKLEGKDISLYVIKNMIKYYDPVKLDEGFNKILYKL